MNKCMGCGKDYEGETGFCFSCRVVLYTPLQIAESDFRHSEFKTMVFPVRDIIWLQDRLRLREAELKAMDIVNDEMVGELAKARDEIAKAKDTINSMDWVAVTQHFDPDYWEAQVADALATKPWSPSTP